jgi:metal transporter CNNM
MLTPALSRSTALIVIFGEVLPQSICARYGLSIGAACAPLVWILMIVLSPIAWPTAKLLDWSLGEDHGTTYKKAELKTLVSLHQQLGTEHLNDDEVTIIRAVLDLNDKTVQDVMTPIQDVFIMSSDTVLDEEGVDKLVQSGYSRVPVHDKGKPDSILGMLLVKDLITYDPEDGKEVGTFNLRPLPETAPDLTLLSTLNYFQTGRSHMLLVTDNPGQPKGALGVVTLEDVVEELIGEEIIDETDVWVDVHNRVRVSGRRNGSTTEANGTPDTDLGPLVRGIIERRRMVGLKQRTTPLKSTYDSAGAGNKATAAKAIDKVHMKRPPSPALSQGANGDYNVKRSMSWSSQRTAGDNKTDSEQHTNSSTNGDPNSGESHNTTLVDTTISEAPAQEDDGKTAEGERQPLLGNIKAKKP